MKLNNKLDSIKKYTIKVTVLLEKSIWTAIFERNDSEGFAVARKIFGNEPTDPELYNFILMNFPELHFTEPQRFDLVIKRKNPKRIQREVRIEMKKIKSSFPKETFAQEILRIDLEQNKKKKRSISSAERARILNEKFLIKQEKKKKKHRDH